MKKYSVCVQVWHKPDGMRSWHKLNLIYIPINAVNKSWARRKINYSINSSNPNGDFKYTVKFANPFNPVYHK